MKYDPAIANQILKFLLIIDLGCPEIYTPL